MEEEEKIEQRFEECKKLNDEIKPILQKYPPHIVVLALVRFVIIICDQAILPLEAYEDVISHLEATKKKLS